MSGGFVPTSPAHACMCAGDAELFTARVYWLNRYDIDRLEEATGRPYPHGQLLRLSGQIFPAADMQRAWGDWQTWPKGWGQ
jgi:hypothetical protein